MSKKILSTFDREMLNPSFKDEFDREYNDFLLAEVIRSMMDKNNKTVRKLAKEADVSSTVIQNIRSGKHEDIKLSNFLNISHACGYEVILKKNDDSIAI